MQPASDIIIALHNIMDRNSTILAPIFRSDGSANAAGDSLEYFVKDMFSPGNRAAQHGNEQAKEQAYSEYLSWTGNSSNFPDFIVKGGVGVEPKKIQSASFSNLSLNSSYPKGYITPQTQNMPAASSIREPEPWTRKEVVYAVGNLPKGQEVANKLKYLWLVYGNTFIADDVIYQSAIQDIREALSNLRGNMMADSKELGRVYGIDPLENTNLRVRGMYELKHPAIAFKDVLDDLDLSFPENSTEIYTVILKSNYEELGEVVDLNDNAHSLEKFMDAGRLTRYAVDLSDPNDTLKTVEAYIFVGYTD
ncbi:NgoPII family restriction endonuclease [Rothia endophytica]|uniref:NgoPII family restriction endonuclease n=1 Tax=Rothia endophytica TaxID=1324766 RepID=UPI001F01DB2C|nr:NgoPII family restriction endonuclease [Rothia endophytica]